MMEPNCLLVDELTYELQIRGVNVEVNALAKRSLLRELLREEREGVVRSFSPVSASEETELRVCQDKLSELNVKTVAYVNSEGLPSEFKRLESRLNHISNRLSRINTTSVEQSSLKCELERKYRQLILNLNNPVKTNTVGSGCLIPEVVSHSSVVNESMSSNVSNEQSILDLSVFELELLSDFLNTTDANTGRDTRRVSFSEPKLSSVEEPIAGNKIDESSLQTRIDNRINSLHFSNEDLPCSTQNRESGGLASGNTYYHSYSTNVNNQVHRWGIHFDGQSGSLNSFLERTQELQLSRNISKNQLFLSAIELFKGDALIWFRAIKNSVYNWEELVEKLKSDFLPSDFNERLWDEVTSRTQGSQERIAVYFAVMENLFNRLTSSVSESTKLKIIRRNLQPYFLDRITFQQFGTIVELKAACKILEDSKHRVDKFKEPPKPSSDTLEPELAYKPLEKKSPPANKFRSPRFRSDLCELAEPQLNAPRSSNNSFVCWNCHEVGHVNRQCTKPKTIFCYRCGLSNVTTNSCRRCPKNLGAGTRGSAGTVPRQ